LSATRPVQVIGLDRKNLPVSSTDRESLQTDAEVPYYQLLNKYSMVHATFSAYDKAAGSNRPSIEFKCSLNPAGGRGSQASHLED